jgi:glycosyltransferase involved in cell wall biosynthesis
MHILLIHQAFAALDEPGGTRHAEMASYLASQGHRVTIISSPVSYLTGQASHKNAGWRERSEPQPGITILRVYTYAALHRSFFHRILAFFSFMVSSFLAGIQVRKVDLVWGTSPPIFQGLTAWLVARLKRIPFLFEVRDLWPAFAVGVLRNPFLIRASQGLEHFLYSHADRVIVNSPGFIDHVTQGGARRVELVPNSADPDMFTPAALGEAFRQANNLVGKFIILYAGAHGMSNDLPVVLEAARRVQSDPGIAIVMLGDGKEKKALQWAAQGLGNVLFLPPVPKTQMAAALAAADACIAILKPLEMYKTTYPNKVFDYMAAGRPVLLVIDGVIRKVVEEAGAGVFIPPGDASALADAMLSLAATPQKAAEMGCRGRLAIEHEFNRIEIAKKMLLVLEELERKNG